MPIIERYCKCGNKFKRYLYPSSIKQGAKGLYCSSTCALKFTTDKRYSKEIGKKISKALTGRKQSKESNLKRSGAWTKEMRLVMGARIKKIKWTRERREKLSESLMGRVSGMLGKKLSLEHNKKLREGLHKYWENRKDEPRKSDFWQLLKNSPLYKDWRKKVFEKDNYTCQICNRFGGYLEPDHIKAKAIIVKEYGITTLEDAYKCKELWDINNGRTLCKKCHRKTDTFGWNMWNNNRK